MLASVMPGRSVDHSTIPTVGITELKDWLVTVMVQGASLPPLPAPASVLVVPPIAGCGAFVAPPRDGPSTSPLGTVTGPPSPSPVPPLPAGGTAIGPLPPLFGAGGTSLGVGSLGSPF